MAGRVSKNQRSATVVGGSKTMQLVGDVRLITPLNHGRHARIYNVVTGTNPHVAVGSSEFDTVVLALAQAGHTAKLIAELNRLADEHPDDGWDRTAGHVTALLDNQTTPE